MSGDPLDPGVVVGLLADGTRRRVLAAIILGAESLEAVATSAGVTASEAARAMDRLASGGLLGTSDQDRFRVMDENLRATAQSAAASRALTRGVPGDDDLPDAQRETLRTFIVDGRLTSIPAGRAKRLVVLDYLAGKFDPGPTYPERQVNEILAAIHPDFATLRRYLVDEGFLARRDGFYWRSGGQFDIE